MYDEMSYNPLEADDNLSSKKYNVKNCTVLQVKAIQLYMANITWFANKYSDIQDSFVYKYWPKNN